jgi:hypothetical protein
MLKEQPRDSSSKQSGGVTSQDLSSVMKDKIAITVIIWD